MSSEEKDGEGAPPEVPKEDEAPKQDTVPPEEGNKEEENKEEGNKEESSIALTAAAKELVDKQSEDAADRAAAAKEAGKETDPKEVEKEETGESKTEEKPAENEPSDEKPAENEPSDEKPAENEPAKAVKTPPKSAGKKGKKRRGRTSFSNKRSSKKKKKEDNGTGVLVSEDFWEIEQFESYRLNKKRMKKSGATPVYEYLVKWKGSDVKTWEPEENLSTAALMDARKFMSEQELQKLGLDKAKDEAKALEDLLDVEKHEEGTEEAATSPVKEENIIDPEDVGGFEDTQWDWTDQGQITFREIERIHVDDPDARKKVTESRQSGVPVVITGHIGWAQFTARWLVVEGEENADAADIVKMEVDDSSKVETKEEEKDETKDEKEEAKDEKEEAKDEKEETKDEKEEAKDETKDDAKEETKDETKDEAKDETKDEAKEETKDEAKDEKPDEDKSTEKKETNETTDEKTADGDKMDVEDEKPSKSETETDSKMETEKESKPETNVEKAAPADDADLASEKGKEEASAVSKPKTKTEKLLDLSKPHQLDVDKMIADIGKESVPVIRRQYNEQDPIHAQITVETFLKKCWPSQEEIENKVPMRKLPWLYLHQWQFPISDTALPKLTGKGQNHPLPHHILGEDLLRFWLDEEKCNKDSPFQYLFMGRQDTKSNLHRDNGGLLISIAPIVGQKEVTLVHRADGPSSLYHLSADIDHADLHQYPMMYSVRAWRSVLKPGEILLMPQGTYHSCRNVTPCLSYSRFYLDTVNLKAFLESYLDKDAPEIQHDEVVWNSSHELNERVNEFVQKVKASQSLDVPHEIESAVESLRVLRNVVREIAMRKDLEAQQKRRKIKEENPWDTMTHEIDQSLHNFRYRLRKKIPVCRRRKLKKGQEIKKEKPKKEPETSAKASSLQSPDVEDEEQPPQSNLEEAIRKLPKLDTEEIGLVVSDSIQLKEGDKVNIRLAGRLAPGTIESVHEKVKAAYLAYDEFPSCHDEYQPVDRLRSRVVGGETSVELSAGDLKEGMHVFHVEPGGEEYRAVVKSWRRATFYVVNIELDGGPGFVHRRWITRDLVADRVAEAAPKKTGGKLPESAPQNEEPEPSGEEVKEEEPKNTSSDDVEMKEADDALNKKEISDAQGVQDSPVAKRPEEEPMDEDEKSSSAV